MATVWRRLSSATVRGREGGESVSLTSATPSLIQVHTHLRVCDGTFGVDEAAIELDEVEPTPPDFVEKTETVSLPGEGSKG